MAYLRLNTSLTALHIDFLFFIINLAQLIVSIRLYKNIEATLTKYYTMILIFASIFINMELFDIPTGVVIVGLLLLVIEKVFDTKMNPLMIGWIVLLDALFFLLHVDETVLSSAYGLVQLGMFAYILWQCYCKKEYMNLNALKKMGVVLVMILSYPVPSNIIHRIGLSTVN